MAVPTAHTVAIVLGAGQGTRMGATQNKVFLPVAGKPLIVYAVATFAAMPEVDEIVLVAHPAEVARFTTIIATHLQMQKPFTIITGGASRHQSEYCALAALRARITSGAIDIILIHDGARPFVPRAAVAEVIVAAHAVGGALLATPVAADEHIVSVAASGVIAHELPTAALWRAQTPQAFQAPLLLAAYDAAQAQGFTGTDTASSFERAGYAVRVVAGSTTNFKVTTPEDLMLAEHVLRQR